MLSHFIRLYDIKFSFDLIDLFDCLESRGIRFKSRYGCRSKSDSRAKYKNTRSMSSTRKIYEKGFDVNG